MNYEAEFYKRYNKLPKVAMLDFEEASERAFRLKYDKALEWLRTRGKQLKITTSWDEISDAAHAKAFTVSTVLKADVLQEVYDYIDKARTDGIPFSEFKKTAFAEGGLVNRMQEAGWTGKEPSRLKTIYTTNLNIAHAKGKFEQMKLLSDERPYWKYKQLQRATKRHTHAQYHNKVFRSDDPIWNDIYPPRDFGCGCSVVAVKDSDSVYNGADFKPNYSQNINPFAEYKPDVTKYSDAIRERLESVFK